MKKLFIGCGVLALLVLGALGYFAWQVWPMVEEFSQKFTVFGSEMVALEEAYPFEHDDPDHLDSERFAASLQVRDDMAARFSAMESELDAYGREQEEADVGILGLLDVVGGALQRFMPIFDDVTTILDGAQMGPSEFSHHTRVLWATLQAVDAGAAGPELEPLRGSFEEFRRRYGEMQRENSEDWPPFDELIGAFEPGVIATAKAVLAVDTQRVLDGLSDPFLEATYMRLDEFTWDFQEMEREMNAGSEGGGAGG